MSKKRNSGLKRRITRRDFLNGMLWTTAASLTMRDWLAAAGDTEVDIYPPSMMGLRGSNDGSFEAAHLLREGKPADFGNAAKTGESYDLIVVGAGVSGLAAAWYFRKTAGKDARILILDNHDDFGGHARRQEFSKDPLLISYGGSYAIESPAPYSTVAQNLIRELGIDVSKFHSYLNLDTYRSRGLGATIHFDEKTFGENRLVPDPFKEEYIGAAPVAENALERFLKESPVNDATKRDLVRLYQEKVDYMPGLSSPEKKAKLASISYSKFLTEVVKCDQGILPIFNARLHSLYGAGMDAIPAQDAWGLGFPGFDGMDLDPEPGPGMNRDAIPEEEAYKYFFHFPDGNASVARLLVRKLLPEAIPGKTAEDIVLAKARYKKLDEPQSPTRIRLSSTVLKVKHSTEKEVEVTYMRNGQLLNVTTSRCILACWHTMIPYLCPELPGAQKTALAYAVKVPIVYARAAIRNWTSFAKLGAQRIYAPGGYFSDVNLSMPLNIGGYTTTRTPEDPVVITLFRSPCRPGLPARHQHRIGRRELLETTFDEFERQIRSQLNDMLAAGGFDAARDITGIAVHRWPHGYAYQYNSLYDPFWLEGKPGPCVEARKPFGRIAIANSDAAAYSYLDAAIDEAHRAVHELLPL